MQLNQDEKDFLKEEEYLKNNKDVVAPKISKAVEFRKDKGYSITFSKLMIKWNCSTPEEYRAIRSKHRKEKYIGPKREKKIIPSSDTRSRN